MKRKILLLVFGLVIVSNVDISASSYQLENFDDINKWKKSEVEVTSSAGVSKLSVQDGDYISKEFCYNIEEKPYISINIPKIEPNVKWSLEVEANDKKFILQEYSNNYNEFDASKDKFIYPLKGYMIQNIKEIPDCYTLKINFSGTGTIEFNDINAISFDEEKQYSFNNDYQDIGDMEMSGDSSLDIDELINDTPIESQLKKEHHWGVYPFSRLALYPAQTMKSIDKTLSLSVSSFYGVNEKGIYKASPELRDFNKVYLNGNEAKSVNSYWLPYKIGINASYPDGELDVTDYFIDKDTIGRQINNNSKMPIEIEIDNNENNDWIYEDGQFLFKSKSELNEYYYVMNFKQDYQIITTKFGYNLKFAPGENVDMALGFATKEQGINYAKENSKVISIYESKELIEKTKKMWESLLKIVPAPKVFGINSEQGDISSKDHKTLYYSAWTYLIGNMMEPTYETGYQFGQQLLGKASMQTEGAPISSGNNSWESILQLQLISMINPNFAKDAIYGFLTMVDANGKLDGEVLPTRFAQSIWIIYNSTGDKEFLENIYPTLKRFMEYKSENLHWVWGGTNIKDEIDSEFIISWLFDSTYMKKIAGELGYDSEVIYWQNIYDFLLKEYYSYFFVDEDSFEAKGAFPSGINGVREDNHPLDKSSRGIWQRYYSDHYNYDGSHMHNNVRGNLPENVHMILSALVIKDLDQNHLERLINLFLDVYDPELSLSGFTNYKYAPNSLLMYGLLERGFPLEFKTLLASDLEKAYSVWTFCELFEYDTNNPLGTLPTSFSVNLIIENTMMLNGISYYTGEVKEINLK